MSLNYQQIHGFDLCLISLNVVSKNTNSTFIN